MEPLLETVQLAIDEPNELTFKIQIEGADNSTPVKVRLVCETGDVAYMFKGEATSDIDVIRFTLPSMKGKIKEGSFPSRVEVLVENRYFAPVNFNLEFKQQVKVVAESVKHVASKKPEIKVTASLPTLKERVAEKAKKTAEAPKKLDEKLIRRAISSMIKKDK